MNLRRMTRFRWIGLAASAAFVAVGLGFLIHNSSLALSSSPGMSSSAPNPPRGRAWDKRELVSARLTRILGPEEAPSVVVAPRAPASPTDTGIYGHLMANGVPVAGVTLALRQYDSSTEVTVATTETDASGYYLFSDIPTLPSGKTYYVRFGPNTVNPAYVSVWFGPDVTAYTAGQLVLGGDLGIADVVLRSPSDNAIATLPATFTWGRRSATSDSYRFFMEDASSTQRWGTGLLGYVGQAILSSLPSGATYDTPYTWYVGAYQGTSSFGFSFYRWMVTYSTVTPTPTPIVPGGPYAFVNHPWDFVEGTANPGTVISATLRRDGVDVAVASATVKVDGLFSLEFRLNGDHVAILSGDDVVLQGGGLNVTIHMVDIAGTIDATANKVTGHLSGGTLPAQGIGSAGWPADLRLASKRFDYDAATGNFIIDFGGLVDITDDSIAKADYEDPNGNRVVQVLFPVGLDIRALIDEGFVEGVAAPGVTVDVMVSDGTSNKGHATVVADSTGFYRTAIYKDGHPVRLHRGDQVTVSRPGRSRSMTLTMYHVSYIQPSDNHIVGMVRGMPLPAGGTQGRVDLWSAAEDRWYRQYVWIGADGNYSADFSGIATMSSADRSRVWATDSSGNQQASLGWGLEIGTSMHDDTVWGYTTVGSTADITVYQGLENGIPAGVIGTASAMADTSGYFSTTVRSDGSPLSISTLNVVAVQTAQSVKTLLIVPTVLRADSAAGTLLIMGPPGSIITVEGRRAGISREAAPYQADYVWREATLDSQGSITVSLHPYALRAGDWFDLTVYGIEDGVALHSMVVAQGSTYLPLTLRDVR